MFVEKIERMQGTCRYKHKWRPTSPSSTKSSSTSPSHPHQISRTSNPKPQTSRRLHQKILTSRSPADRRRNVVVNLQERIPLRPGRERRLQLLAIRAPAHQSTDTQALRARRLAAGARGDSGSEECGGSCCAVSFHTHTQVLPICLETIG